MDANSEQMKTIKSFLSIGKSVIPISGITIGLLLAVPAYFKYVAYNSVAIMYAIYSIFALGISITLLIHKKRASIYSSLCLIIGILFISSSLLLGYSNTLIFPEKAYPRQIGIAYVVMGGGLTFMTLAITMFGLNKSGLAPKAKYPNFIMVFIFICGFVMFAFGIYLFFM